MLSLVRHWVMMPVFAAGATAIAVVTGTQPGSRDGIGDLIKRTDTGAQVVQAQVTPSAPPPPVAAQAPAAPEPPANRDADANSEQAQRLMKAVDALLQDAARNRGEARKLPTEKDYIVRPIWTETREDRERRIRELLDSALGVVTDVPVVDLQKKIEGLRKNIREHDDRIVRLREKQLIAPKDGMLPGYVTDTVDSLGKDIDETKKRIELNRGEIAKTKTEVQEALKKAGVQLSPEQVDLLLDSVLSGDLVRLVAVFNSAKMIDGQLGKLMTASGENIGAARKYFAMHAALFALLVHSQDLLIDQDRQAVPAQAFRDRGRYPQGTRQDGGTAEAGEPRGPEAGARRQPREPAPGRRRRQGLPPLPAAAARADRQGAPAGDPRLAHRRQHLRDGGGKLPAAQPDARCRRLLRGDPETRGADVRPDLQERGAAPRVREPHAQAGRADELTFGELSRQAETKQGLAR